MIVLIGAWNENNENDKQAIESITGIDYSQLLSFARERLNAGDPYIALTDGIWRVTLRKDIFPLVKDFLFDNTICNAFNVASQLVNEQSKRFENEDAIGVFVPSGGWFSNSDSFRKGLCEGLCLMANNDPPKNSSLGLVEQQAFLLVRNLFEKCSWKTLAGLEELTSVLAEMSPKAFLMELESFAIQRSQELKKLFPAKNQRAVSDGNFITYLLWPLEELAWIPEYFGACVRCLGIIELTEYEKSHYRNTPFVSLIAILNAFRPQTFASTQQKKNAILSLKNDSQDLCWDVIDALLPTASFSLMDTSKPKYIDVASWERDIDQNESTELLRYYIDIAVLLSSGSAKRLAALSTHLRYMSVDMVSDYFKKIIGSAEDWTDELRYQVWDSLCNLRERAKLNRKQIKQDSDLSYLLGCAISASKPQSKWYQYLRLYTNKTKEYPLNDAHGFTDYETARSKAILELYDRYGVDKVISFGERVKRLSDVGQKLGKELNSSQIKDILKRYSQDQDSSFYFAVLRSFIAVNGVLSLDETGIEKYAEPFRAKVLCAAPFTPDTFSHLNHFLLDRTIYWKTVPVQWIVPEWTKETIESVIHELVEVERFDVIINSVGQNLNELNIENELLKTVMLRAVYKNEIDQLDTYAVCSIIARFQLETKPDIDTLAEIEFAYLPLLKQQSTTHPKALYYKLSNDSGFFCDLMELAYKPHHAKRSDHTLSEGVSQRLYQLIFDFRIVPGVDWNGVFKPDRFKEWIAASLQWADRMDRLAVVQLTIGNGLSYANTIDGLPDEEIMEELNQPRNNDMRTGYQIGIRNQRGGYWVDPEGKPELALSEQYSNYANAADERGFSRFAETLRDISDSYLKDAIRIKREHALFE